MTRRKLFSSKIWKHPDFGVSFVSILKKCKCKRTQKTTRELPIFPEQKNRAVRPMLSIQTCLGHETKFNAENSFDVSLGIHSVCFPLNAISKSFQKMSSRHTHSTGLTDEAGLHCKVGMAHFTWLAWPQPPSLLVSAFLDALGEERDQTRSSVDTRWLRANIAETCISLV